MPRISMVATPVFDHFPSLPSDGNLEGKLSRVHDYKLVVFHLLVTRLLDL